MLGLTGSVCVVIAVPRLADLHTTCDSGSLLTLNKWNIFGYFFFGFPPLANLTEGWLCIFAENKCIALFSDKDQKNAFMNGVSSMYEHPRLLHSCIYM